MVLGPTEEPFQRARRAAPLARCEADLVRGAPLVDTRLADRLHAVRLRRRRRAPRRRAPQPPHGALPRPLSPASAPSRSAWESVMNLRAAPPQPAAPATRQPLRFEADAARPQRSSRTKRCGSSAEQQAMADQDPRSSSTRSSTATAADPRVCRRRHAAQRCDRFAAAQGRAARAARPRSTRSPAPPRVSSAGCRSPVAPGSSELGYDPDTETVAVATVVDELERLGWSSTTARPPGSATTCSPAARHHRAAPGRGQGLHRRSRRRSYSSSTSGHRPSSAASDYWLYVVTQLRHHARPWSSALRTRPAR